MMQMFGSSIQIYKEIEREMEHRRDLSETSALAKWKTKLLVHSPANPEEDEVMIQEFMFEVDIKCTLIGLPQPIPEGNEDGP